MTTPGGPAPANNAMGGSAVGGVPIGTAGSPFASNNERWSNNVQTEHPFNNFVNRYTPRLGQQIATTSAQGVAKQFPNVIERGDSRDDYYNFRASVTDGRGNIPGMGMTVAGDNDIAYLRKKGQDAIEAAFNGYLLDQMVLNTPEAQDYWQKNFPDVFQEKIKLVEDQLDIQAKLAKIRILGPKTREDYMLLFAIQHGYIAVPAGPVFDPNSLEKTDFHRGLFNIKKWLLSNDTANADRNDPLRLGGRSAYPSVTEKADFLRAGTTVNAGNWTSPPARGGPGGGLMGSTNRF
jgi:hypothetical protein